MFRALIVEDTDAEAIALERCLERFADQRGEQFHVTRLRSAVEFLEGSHPADLIFMDIDLPGLTGMEAAEALREFDRETPLVFVTNLAQYAVHGYAVDAVGFIVKPVSYGDFALCMERVMRVLRRAARQTITVPTHDGVRVVDIADLAYIDVRGHDATYHLAGGGILTQRATLSSIARQLEGLDAPFVNVSASCLVNMAHVLRIRGDEVVLTGGASVYLSRGKKRAALDRIADYLGGA